MNGGIPRKATVIGWTEENNYSDLPTYKSHGPCVGWVNWDADEIYIDINSGYNVIRKTAGQELSLTKQTLFKRMKDAGTLIRIDEGRQRNTIRVTAEGHPRQVLCVSASSTLESQEVPADEE